MEFKLIVLCLVAMIQTGFAIQCYDCMHAVFETNDAPTRAMLDEITADNDNECLKNGEDFTANPSSTVTCTSTSNTYARCGKAYYDMKVTYIGVSIDVVLNLRECLLHDKDKVGCEKDFDIITAGFDASIDIKSGKGEYCLCDTERCNSATSLLASSSLMLAVAAAYLMQ